MHLITTTVHGISSSGNTGSYFATKTTDKAINVLIFWDLCCRKLNAMEVIEWPNPDFFFKKAITTYDVEIRGKYCLKQDETHSNAALCLKSLVQIHHNNHLTFSATQ